MDQPTGGPDKPFSLRNPSDAFFRETFSHLPTSRGLLENLLPPVLKRQADLAQLARAPESFLGADLRSRFADLLFSCPIGGRPGFFYLLLEHKSTPEYWTSFHLLELIVRIWRKHLDNTGYAQAPLPMVIPIVLHQGPKGWTPAVHFADYIGWPEEGREEIARFLPSFEHLLLDLSRLPWEEITGEARLRLAISLMKAVRENRVLEVLPRVAHLMAELGSDESKTSFLQVLVRYMMETGEKLNSSTIRQLADKLPSNEAKIEVMTLADYLREEGREEGRELGRQEGRTEGQEIGFLIGQIVTCREILGLPPLFQEELASKSRGELTGILAQLKSELARHFKH